MVTWEFVDSIYAVFLGFFSIFNPLLGGLTVTCALVGTASFGTDLCLRRAPVTESFLQPVVGKSFPVTPGGTLTIDQGCSTPVCNKRHQIAKDNSLQNVTFTSSGKSTLNGNGKKWWDLEWKVIYVGSAESEAYDQELDCVMVGPVTMGENKFILENKIPKNEMLGVTFLLVTCSYRGKEFTRIGYYVNNDYANPEMYASSKKVIVNARRCDIPPPTVDLSLVARSILVSKSHVTNFPIVWDIAPASDQTQSRSNDSFFADSQGDEGLRSPVVWPAFYSSGFCINLKY